MSDAETPAEPTGPPPVVRVPLRAPPFWSPSFTMMFGGVALVLGVGGYLSMWPPGGDTAADFALKLGLPFVLSGIVLGLRQLTRPRAVPPLMFYDDHLEAPRSAESRHGYRISYDDILSVDLRGRGAAERLFIGTRQRLLSLPRPAFERPEAVEQVLKELYMRILRRPEGSRIVEEIARRRRAALVALSHPPLATHVLLAGIALVFGLEFAGGAFEQGGLGQVRFGANAPILVQDGEVWRLFSSLFLHATLLHLYFSGLTLFFVGGVLERLLGRSRFMVIFLFSGLGGTLASAAFTGELFTVGASAAILGLLGSYAVVSLRFGADLPVGFRQPLRWWVVVGGLQLLLPFILPGVDYVSFGGALLMAVVATLLVVDPKEALDPELRAGNGVRVLAGVLGLLCFASMGTALGEALRKDRDGVLRFARRMLEAPAATPYSLNALAWAFAIDKQASHDGLRLAYAAAERSLAGTDRQTRQGRAVLDTVAAVNHRLGNADQAVSQGREVLEGEPNGYYATHLATYLAARPATPPPELGVSFAEGAVAVDLSAETPSGMTAYVILQKGEERVGLLRVELGSGGPRQVHLSPGVQLDPAGRLSVAWYEPRCDCDGGSAELAAWALLPSDVP